MPGVHLDALGRNQARSLADHFADEGIAGVFSSPRERAVETAQPIAERAGVELRIEPDIDELDCGEWTGCAFASLDQEPLWQNWNIKRSQARIPAGESMSDVQVRVLR